MKLEALRNTDKLIVAAHRGYSARFPENSLLAFREAASLGVDVIELDVMLTKDNVPVIAHDDRLDRLSNGTGLILDYTYDELRKLDFGINHGAEFAGLKLPTFRQAMSLIKGFPNVIVDVDMKIGPAIHKTLDIALEVIKELGMENRCIYNSCDGEIIERLYNAGQITVGAPKSYADKVNYTDETYNRLWSVCIPLDELSYEAALQYRQRGIKVMATSPDTPEQLRFAINYGVSIFMTDNPVSALQAAAALN